MADLMELNIEELARLETLDNGKPLVIARAADITACIKYLRYFAGCEFFWTTAPDLLSEWNMHWMLHFMLPILGSSSISKRWYHIGNSMNSLSRFDSVRYHSSGLLISKPTDLYC